MSCSASLLLSSAMINLLFIGLGPMGQGLAQNSNSLLSQFPKIAEVVSLSSCPEDCVSPLYRFGTLELPIKLVDSEDRLLGEIYRVLPGSALILLAGGPDSNLNFYEISWPAYHLEEEAEETVLRNPEASEVIAVLGTCSIGIEVRSTGEKLSTEIARIELLPIHLGPND